MIGSSRRTWIVIGTVAAAAAVLYFGVRRLQKTRERKRLVDRVVSYNKALAEYERCLTAGAPGPFLTAIMFAHPAGLGDDERADTCAKPLDATLATFGNTVRRLGLRAEPMTASASTISRDALDAPFLAHPEPLEGARELCGWVFDAQRDLALMSKTIGRPPVPDVECTISIAERFRPPLLQTLGGYLSQYLVDPIQVAIRRGPAAPSMRDVFAFLPTSDPERFTSAIGRSVDGENWKGLDVPRDVVVAAPAPSGFIAVARGARWELRANDGTNEGWKTISRFPPRAEALWLHADDARITLVATRRAAPDIVEVVSSTNGGKSFGAPVRLIDRSGAAATDVRVLADGTVLALSLPREAPNQAELATLAPGATEATTARLALETAIAGPSITACHGRTSYFAVLGNRFVVNASGGAPTQLLDLGTAAHPVDLYCTADRVLVLTHDENDHLDLRACTVKSCDAAASVASNDTVVFSRVQPDHIEVWLANRNAMRNAESDGYPIRVYSLAGHVLAPKRFYVMPEIDDDEVSARFVNLGDAIGWIDPRSGAGEGPWVLPTES